MNTEDKIRRLEDTVTKANKEIRDLRDEQWAKRQATRREVAASRPARSDPIDRRGTYNGRRGDRTDYMSHG